ncbi:MAG: cyclic pyranopterin monophosphate synthase MoaC [Anaerolineaceae bacterium]|nr:cyclic pyranopterin monophosphate synthase MoaC [Anaerolineaceae bacterium]
MVDVSSKASTERMAIARGEVHLQKETLSLIQDKLMKKGDVLSVAQIAGILGAKNTSTLIPLCHPIMINYISVDLNIDDKICGIIIQAEVRTKGSTGVEMEALTAVSIAALTVYDMVKSVEKRASIQNIHLVEKHGGASGDFYNK